MQWPQRSRKAVEQHCEKHGIEWGEFIEYEVSINSTTLAGWVLEDVVQLTLKGKSFNNIAEYQPWRKMISYEVE